MSLTFNWEWKYNSYQYPANTKQWVDKISQRKQLKTPQVVRLNFIIYVPTQYPRGTSFPHIWKFLTAPFSLATSSCFISAGFNSSKFTSISALPFRHLREVTFHKWNRKISPKQKQGVIKNVFSPHRRMMNHQKLKKLYKGCSSFRLDHLKACM